VDLVLLFVGLGGLWLGTEAAIRGAVTIAGRLGVSEFIIGVAILSVGSDLPELAIAVDAALKNLQGADASDLVVGSALGSGLGQIGFVLGIAGLLAYLTLPRLIVYQHGSVLLGSLVLLGIFGFDGIVSRPEGLALVTFYLVYLFLLFTERATPSADETEFGLDGLFMALVHLAVGLAIVIGAAELTVTSATTLALEMGIKQSFVAIIIIGLGSSLPELTISLVAVAKGRTRLSVGNLVGSNIFDSLVPIGVAAAITDLAFNPAMLRFELPFLFVVTATVLLFFVRRRGIQKIEAAVILVTYVVYAMIKLILAPA
jgi:cation:H+ antiporter